MGRGLAQARRATGDASAKTAFLLARGFDRFRTGSVIVVLQPQFANPSDHKVKLRQVRILSVHGASDDGHIRVCTKSVVRIATGQREAEAILGPSPVRARPSKSPLWLTILCVCEARSNPACGAADDQEGCACRRG